MYIADKNSFGYKNTFLSSKNTKRFLLVFLLLLVLCSAFFLTSCSDNVSLQNYKNFTCYYDATTNKTQVIWNFNIFNDYYLSTKSYTFYLSGYFNNQIVDSDYTLLKEIIVGPGETYPATLSFYIDGQIDKVEVIKFHSDYDSLWNTYFGWLVGAIVVVGVVSIGYIIFAIVKDVDWEDFCDFISEHVFMTLTCIIGPILVALIPVFITYGSKWGPWQWGILIICLSALVLIIVNVLFYHLIVLIKDRIKYGPDYRYYTPLIFSSSDETKNTNRNSNGFSDDFQKMNKQQLIGYCEENSVISNPNRFYNYTKQQIISFIKKWHNDEDVEFEMNSKLMEMNFDELKSYCDKASIEYKNYDDEVNLIYRILDIDQRDFCNWDFLNSLSLEELQGIVEEYDLEDEIEDFDDEEELMRFIFQNKLNAKKYIGILYNDDDDDELDEDDDLDEEHDEDSNEENGKAKNKSKQENESSDTSNKNKSKSKGITLDDIAGLQRVKDAFNEKVILPIQYSHLYKNFNKKTGGGILLYGLPGTGKTMFAEAISNEIDAKFFSLKCSDIKSKWIGESEQRIKKVFSDARKQKRAIIFFDEFEAIGRKRSSGDESFDAANDIVPESEQSFFGGHLDNVDKKDGL